MLKTRKVLTVFGFMAGLIVMGILVWFGYGGFVDSKIVFEGSALDWYWSIILLVFWLFVFLINYIYSSKKESKALFELISYLTQESNTNFDNVLKYCRNTRELLLDYREEADKRFSKIESASGLDGTADEVV